ncbi:hypothetical protein Q4555_01735 [Octadecabacter sp. 1_MG-2023]|uniref:hypothetical protein n=1 Tax=unclassified Octadecabacter TaxID=196158 RepID=UPI001C08BE2D|nr:MULTISPECIES: hypothetical protein [unclassified Octadecabacter]MBU2993178.1 hypothetical protein [Octadecabacter sp. B2R22]MDO6733370.1 hypothetical protein [Octadecabacter sp. 1_MG-2023]
MPVTQDIVETYRRPRQVVRRLYGMGPREDRGILWLMIGCFLMFISRLPGLQRQAVQTGSDFQQDTIYAFFTLLMLLPLVFYLIAGILFAVTKLIRPNATGYGARVAVFWGWLAATPIALFYGLLVGLNGLEHPGTTLVGGIWLAVLLWFWISGLAEISKAD